MVLSISDIAIWIVLEPPINGIDIYYNFHQAEARDKFM